MLYFMNPDHNPLPGSTTCPWVEVTDKAEIEGDKGYVAKTSFKLRDNLDTDGWAVRDHRITWNTGTGYATAITTFTNTQLLPDMRDIRGGFETYALMVAAPTPSTGIYVVCRNDENATGDAYMQENLYVVDYTVEDHYRFVGTLAKKWRVLYATKGNLGITLDPTSSGGPNNYTLTFNNTASGWRRLILSTAQPIPKPNDTVDISIGGTDWITGDLITVGYNDADGKFVAQYVGLYEEYESGKARLRVLVSDYDYGGVKQYSTYSAFPAIGEETFLYVAQDTQYSYTWHDNAYHIVTDISGKANLYTKGSITYDVKDILDLYDSLKLLYDEDHLALTTHIADKVVHITKDERDTWNAAKSTIDTHINTADLHFDVTTQPTTENVTKLKTKLHLQDAERTSQSYHHMTDADWTKLRGAASLTYVEDEVKEIEKDIAGLAKDIAALSNLGRYLETYDTEVDMYAVTMAQLLDKFPAVTINDFCNVRVDSTQEPKGSSTRYIFSGQTTPAPPDPAMPIWTFDMVLDEELTGIMNIISSPMAGYIPTIGDDNKGQLNGPQIDPSTLSLKTELQAHEIAQDTKGGYIHVDDEDRDSWDTAAINIKGHIDDSTVHLKTGERDKWDKTTTDLDTHTKNTTVHVTSEERTKWNGKADASDLSTEVTARVDGDKALGDKIAAIRDKGVYLGTVQSDNLLPTTISSSFNAKLGDFMFVNSSDLYNSNIVLYCITEIDSDGKIKWKADQPWRNTAVSLTLYTRQLTIVHDDTFDNLSTMPASLDNREYFDIVFATENTVLRFIAGQENSCKNLFQWMKVNSTSAPDGGAQRVLYSNLAHWFSLSFPANNSYVGGDAGHDRNIQLRDFGTNNSSLLNNWYRTNDGSGILMNLQERNESTYIFPKTGNIYNLLIIDTSPASSTSVITPFIEVRRAHAEMKVVDSAHNNGTITIT